MGQEDVNRAAKWLVQDYLDRGGTIPPMSERNTGGDPWQGGAPVRFDSVSRPLTPTTRPTGVIKVNSLRWLQVAHRLAVMEHRWPWLRVVTNRVLHRALTYEATPDQPDDTRAWSES